MQKNLSDACRSEVPSDLPLEAAKDVRRWGGRLKSASAPRTIVAALFASIVAFMLLLAGAGFEVLSASRSFVAAESMWSKSERDAVRSLNSYARSGDLRDYQRFQEQLAVPIASRMFRLEMQKPQPNLKAAQEYGLLARIHPEDVGDVITFFGRFYNAPHMARAVELWTKTDDQIWLIKTLGAQIRTVVVSSTDPAKVQRLLEDVNRAEHSLPPMETGFAEAIGEVARWSKYRFQLTLAMSAVFLLTLGILSTWRLLLLAREANERYRLLINNANDAIVITSRTTGVVLEINLKAEELIGRPSANVAGSKLEHLFIKQSGTSAPETLTAGSPPMELMLANEDGSGVPVEVTSKQVGIGGREVTVSILRDLSDRKRLEKQLRQAAKMDAVGRLAGGVAHDFNNLLTIITGYGSLLRRRFEVGDPQRDTVDQVLGAAERAAELTRQLLSFSRPQITQSKAVDVNSLVTGVEDMLGRLIGEHIQLAVERSPGPQFVQADKGQLEQVIVNLAVNARDAMPAGGRLTISVSRCDLTGQEALPSPGLSAGSYVVVRVRDTGHGMDEKTKSCIFEPFFTTKEAGKGTGLGLATVYGIVQQSHGQVIVESAVGRGTTFSIYFPRTEAPRATVAPVLQPATTGGRETILLVEDQKELRTLLQTVLRRHGYTVIEAPNGAEGCAKYEQFRESVQMVITDVVMPEMGGVQLGTRVHQQSPNVLVLYISGYPEAAEVCSPGESKRSSLLQKPFTPDVLARRVREMLDSLKSAPGLGTKQTV